MPKRSHTEKEAKDAAKVRAGTPRTDPDYKEVSEDAKSKKYALEEARRYGTNPRWL